MLGFKNCLTKRMYHIYKQPVVRGKKRQLEGSFHSVFILIINNNNVTNLNYLVANKLNVPCGNAVSTEAVEGGGGYN